MAGSAGNDPRERADVDDASRLCRVDQNLFVWTSLQEAGERVHERQATPDGEPSRLRHHVLFSDAALDEAVRELVRERDQTGVEDEVAVEGDDSFVATSETAQPIAIGVDESAADRRDSRVGLEGTGRDRAESDVRQ